MNYRVSYIGGTHDGMRETLSGVNRKIEKMTQRSGACPTSITFPTETYHLTRLKKDGKNYYLYIHEDLINEQ